MRSETAADGTIYYYDDNNLVIGRYNRNRPALNYGMDPTLWSIIQSFTVPVQSGLTHEEWVAEQGLREKVAGWTKDYNDGDLRLRQLSADIEKSRIAAEQAEATGNREDARLARELEAQLRREEMALNERLAGLEHEIAEGQLALNQRQYEQSVKQWESERAANPVDVVQYELYKRGGGAAPQGQGVAAGQEVARQAVAAPAAPSAQAAATLGKFTQPEAEVTPPVGTTQFTPQLLDILNQFKATTKRPPTTLLGGLTAMGRGGEIRLLVGEAVKGKPNPELVEVNRKRIKVTPVQSAQTGTELDLPEAHTDQEMQDLLAGIINQPYRLYNPRLGGTGVFGAHVPSPNEMSRRKYLGMDPNQLDVLQSFLQKGIDMGKGYRTAINPQDWFQMMSRSWIPGANTGAPEYSY